MVGSRFSGEQFHPDGSDEREGKRESRERRVAGHLRPGLDGH
jgi:hypothetical protein